MAKANEKLGDEARRRVYIQCRPIFSGKNAEIRKRKAITGLVERSESLRPLLQDVGKDKVIKILRELLEGCVFESELRAKAAFPDLFRPSPHRDAQRQASELSAARSTAEALTGISSHALGEQSTAPQKEAANKVVTVTTVGPNVVEPPARPEPEKSAEKGSCSSKHPSLYPTYLTYQAQHVILNKAQQVLEECCFDFAVEFMPEVLQGRNWECPAAAELSDWTTMFLKGKSTRPGLPKELGEEGKDLLGDVADIRHTAVHRVRTTAKGVCRLLESAVKFARVLRDDGRAEQLNELRAELSSKIKAMELNKNVLEDMLASDLQMIQKQREELDKKEATLIQVMLKHDMDNKGLIGQLLENTVHKIFEKHGSDNQEDGEDADDDGGEHSGPEDWWDAETEIEGSIALFEAY